MSQEDHYYTLPLSLLRNCASPVDTLDKAIEIGIVNAGLGVEAVRGPEAFERLLQGAREEAKEQEMRHLPPKEPQIRDVSGRGLDYAEAQRLWNAALVGAKLLGVTGGKRLQDVQSWVTYYRRGEVYFRIKDDWVWQALATAKRDAGADQGYIECPISWREFRVLAALLAARVNRHHFAFCSWEMIQTLACGFHSKAAFQTFARSTLPGHCQPLTRYMIRDATQTLEALGFYARCRYSRGKAGGFMAYSFRHPRREDLHSAIRQWDAANHSFETKTAGLRTADLLAFANSPPSVRQLTANLSPSPPPTSPPSGPPSPPPT